MGKPYKLTKRTISRHVRALCQQCDRMAHALDVAGMPPARDRKGDFAPYSELSSISRFPCMRGGNLGQAGKSIGQHYGFARSSCEGAYSSELWPIGSKDPLCTGTGDGNPLG